MANPPAAATSATGDPRLRLSASIEARFRRNLGLAPEFQSVVYFLWRERNSRLFTQSSKPSQVILREIHLQIRARLWVWIGSISAICVPPLFRPVTTPRGIGQHTCPSATVFTIIYSPEAYHHSLTHSSHRWIWRRQDPRYVSDLEIIWEDVTKTLESVQEGRTIGVLNFDLNEIQRWREVAKTKDSEDDEKIEVPTKRLDMIAVKLPCRKEGNWSRDVGRLHLQMTAAAVAASAKGFFRSHLMFVTRCFPIPNLFRCKDLVSRRGDVWLYKPDLDTFRDKLKLPIGSCELSLPLGIKAIAAAQSIRQPGSTRDLVILVDEKHQRLIGYHQSGLEAAGWQIRTIQRIRNPKAEKDAYNEWKNYSKFRLWQLTDYDKIIFLDADLLFLRNIDFMFSMPEISATGDNGTPFNSGVMVIEPCNCTFQLLMDHINENESYNGGDQGYLNEVFTWWRRIPKHMNYLKHFRVGDEDDVKRKKTELFGAEPPILYVLHYLGMKPWLCYRHIR
ncbi:hypothetical protein HA466_0027680 [Hirschfeldia incana]|nr:hypothetical protein HA466_0027680 [Hirschfeldia incana]